MILAMLVSCVLSASPEGGGDRAPDATAEVAYKAAKAAAGRDADAQVRLALWCESHGMAAERTKHLTLATLIDPSNVAARGLLGMVQHGGKWLSPEAVAAAIQADPEQQARVREYLERRANAADKADDQMKLALWCEDAGLKDQATAHFHRAVRLDPGRELAWRHLGYKKEKGRWAKPEQIAAEKEYAELQAKANKHWKPILEKIRSGLSSKKGEDRAKAEAALAEINDPAALPTIWATFAQGDAKRQAVAVKLFGRIDAPASSRALAMLSISSPSKDIRREALERLKRKDPRDFADIPIAMIRKPIEYEVRGKVGSETPGELFVKGQDRNWRRLFRGLTMPEFALGDTDQLIYDNQGRPVIRRHFNRDSPFGQALLGPWNGPVNFSTTFASANPAAISSALSHAGIAAGDAAKLGQVVANSANDPGNRIAQARARGFSGPMVGTGYGTIAASIDENSDNGFRSSVDIPIGEMAEDVQQSARSAQDQLDSEVKRIEDYNRPIRDMNRQARQVLADTTGVDLGEDPGKWQNWLLDIMGLAGPAAAPASSQVTTTVEDVPVDFQPRVDPQLTNLLALGTLSCFAAGTTVRTADGPVPIESIKAGDRVLVQDTSTGAMGFSPVLTAYHNPPNATLKIGFEGDTPPVVATGIHRFWKVGQGWAMARDLEPGDTLRAIGGVVKVRSVESDANQPVFNLRVATGGSFFVGDSGVLAHDNSLVNPAGKPFDRIAPADLASADRK